LSGNLAHIDRVYAAAHSSGATSRIAASWRRSMVNHGLDPANTKPIQRLDQAGIDRRRSKLGELHGLAVTEIDRLWQIVGSAGSGLYLTDKDAVVIDHRRDGGYDAEFNKVGLGLGAACGEDSVGTNGMGTCLADLRPAIIHREEHFHARDAGMTCIGTPIYGAQGEVIAALDFSSARVDMNRSGNLLIAEVLLQGARRIEAAYFRSRHPGTRILVVDRAGIDGTALLAIDSYDIVVGATRAARMAFNLAIEGKVVRIPASDLLGLTNPENDLSAAQRSAIMRAMARTSGNVSKAARELGVGRATLYRQIQRLKIER
jgi:transcriptional regulator of acetoin/glycerol metabolism